MDGRKTALRLAPVAAFALLAGAAPLGAQSPARVRIIQRDTTRGDSAWTRLTLDMGEIMRMTSELMASKALEERVAMALRHEVDPAREKELEAQLAEIAKKRSNIVSKLQLQCSRTDDVPEGYIGVTFVDETGIVSSIEPGSPAEKSGLRRGDEILRINGYAPGNAPLATMLKPGAKVLVKVQRDGAPKDVAVVAAKRPDGFGTTVCTGIEDIIEPERTPPVATFMRTPRPKLAPVPTPPSVPTPPPPSNFVYSFSTTPGMGAVAGASVTPVDDDWRETLGVEKGLVVISVASGSPAAESGLRKGDVIQLVDDAPVQSVRTLQRALNDAESRTVKLQVVRHGKTQVLTLRWR